MKVTINNQVYIYSDAIRDREIIRHSFNDLAAKTFGLSFESWYHGGYWRDKYVPHVLLDNERVVSNVSVNILDYNLNGEQKRFVQLGTVMTDAPYRGQGLSRFLMEKVLDEWAGQCDGIYLYANDSVTEFYPRFGFRKANEYQCETSIEPGNGTAIRLNMDKKADAGLLLRLYEHGNPFSALPLIENKELVMFYCSGPMKRNVYYCRAQDVVVIAEFNGNTMICWDIFGSCSGSIEDIIHSVAERETKHIVFGFTPKEQSKMQVVPIHEPDSTLFWHGSNECVFEKRKMRFPLISHT